MQPNPDPHSELEALHARSQALEATLIMLKYLEGANDALRRVSMLNMDYATRLPEGYLERFNEIILAFSPPKDLPHAKTS